MDVIYRLHAFTDLFQDSKRLSPAECAWLNRPDRKFREEDWEEEYPTNKVTICAVNMTLLLLRSTREK